MEYVKFNVPIAINFMLAKQSKTIEKALNRTLKCV